VAEFLTDAWLAELDAAAGAAALPDDLHLVVQQVVLDDRGRETAYTIRILGGHASVTAGRVDDADVTFTQDRATAAAIARGELSAQVAFMAGRLRVGGDLHEVMDRNQKLVDLGDLFAPARADTSW
jgi:putative sterol carrier protein